MASISQLRPRSAEAEALVSRLSSEDDLKMDTQTASEDDDSSEHSHSGAMSGQRLLQATGQRLPAILAVMFVVMLIFSFTAIPRVPHMQYRGHHASITREHEFDDVPSDAASWNTADSITNMAHSMAVNLTESVQLDSARSLPDNSVEASSPAATSTPASDSTGKEPTSVTSDANTGLTALAANNSFVSSATASDSDSTRNQTKPKSTPRQCPALVVPHEYQPDGHPPHNHAQAHVVHSPKTLEKPSAERVLIVAANSGGSCALPLGDYYTFLSMLDKLQYGNLHGYDVLLGMGNIDPTLLATWNKVGWMMKALNDTSREEAEWILWMDLDTIAVESDIAFPLERYAGKDLVLWIMPDEVLHGNPMRLNTGVMLIRNTNWARDFIADVVRLGRQHVQHWMLMDEVLKEELQGAPFASGLFDQNMVAYLMKRYPANIMPHVYAANLDFRINENWIDYVGYNFSQLHTEADTILVSHFSGCSMCAAKDHNENLTLCESEFQRTFEFANCTYGNMGQNTDAVYTKEVHAMLSQLPFCRHKPTPEQCLQYMDADQFGVDQAATQASHHRHVLSQMPELYSQDRSSPQLFEQASETLPVFTYRRLLGQHPSAHNSE